ncbi:GNAT family N-acetyltransferase [Albimonas sp. CAU 1670]|uniref:GNAT family N-acetyltransferase n=1 Tax=Albimonas sp. CAU 1670 TaxID=3032599 RepID=UPI0023DBF584|nr:GNAT family N-acetyltransferase [Albimonas sp. CAU 1670]MDF2233485.1 GNAT family N-acetyltransferase [Albimonas sp. CAU 1670]
MTAGLRIAPVAPTFDDWDGLLDLIRQAFAYMEGRIDPPSSLGRMDAAALKAKAGEETLLLAHAPADGPDGAPRLVGCLFAAERPGALYVGKLAVRPDLQGAGVGAALMGAAEALARARGLPALELQTRVELTGNHAAFARMGFVKVGETRHPGYDRATSLTFRKTLDVA